jgi:hypothetical protein
LEETWQDIIKTQISVNKDLFGYFIELKNNYNDDNKILSLFENYDINKLDINRIYRYLEKYTKENPNGTQDKEIEIDSRTSDAIAIGLRFNCPIYTFDFILSSAGIALEGDTSSSDIFGEISDEEVDDESTVNEFSRYSDEQLDELLEKSLDEEEYEKASRIRDEMKNRGKL